MRNKLNMRKKAQMSYEVDPEKMFPTFEKEQTIDTVTRWLQSEFSSDEIQNLIVEHKLRDYIYYTLIGMYSHLVDKNKLSKNVLKQLAREMTHEWEVGGSPLSIPTDIKELTKIDPALQKLLNKYTADEIFDIASGRKDATEEEVIQAKDVITRGIVAGKLNMRKKAQEEDINEDFGPAGKDRDGKSLFVGDLVEIISSAEIEDLVGVPGVLPDDDVKILEGEAGYISKVNLDGNICLDLDGGWEVTTSPWNVRKLKTSIVPGKEEEKEKLAMNPSTPPETLAELSKDKDDWVRARVAENTNTSPETLTELAKDEDDIVRKYVGLNHSTPLETLTELSKDEDDWVRYFVALNPSTPPETLAELAKDEVKMIRRNVTLNPSTPSVLQQKVLKVIEEPEETMEASPYTELLRKYTADEIFDIAAGRKEATEEEVALAKEVITRGIVSNRLSMRKKADSWEEEEEELVEGRNKEFLKELGNIGRKKLGNRRRAMVTKDELRKLYKQEVKGIYDEELADAIITDFVYELEDIVGVSIEDVDEQDRETLDEERLVQLLQQAKTPQEKMIAIDQVIHTVHEGGTYGKYLIKELWAMSRGEDYGENYLEKEEAFFRELSNLKISRLSMRKFSQSTPETIQKAQAGDENAIAQVIEENIGLISQALINWGYTPKSDEFEDVMSDIKVEMLNRIIPQYDSSKGVFSTFLSTAVYNFLRRGTRKKEYEEKQKEVSLAEPVEEGITIEDTLEDKTSEVVQMTLSSARENLQSWLHMEKPDLEEVVLRVFDLKVEEYTHEQIAEALNQEGYTSKGKSFTRTMVNNYVNDWIKPALAQFFEAFKTAKLSMRKKAQEGEDFLIETKVGKSDWCDKCSLQKPSYRLDIGGDAGIYLCEECWEEEMNYRQEQDVTFQRLPWPGKISIEVPYADLLNKYTEDEIWDIARGKKTDATEEEIQMATEVITRGIVANRLSMRKKADEDEPDVPEPEVTKQELKNLYIQEAKGIYDEEAMDFIISDFIRVFEEWLIYGAWSLKYEYESEEDKKSRIYKYEVEQIEDEKKLLQILQRAKTPQEKMIAIDQVIHTAHLSGVYGSFLIKDIELEGDSFYDELSNLKISSLHMRKGINE